MSALKYSAKIQSSVTGYGIIKQCPHDIPFTQKVLKCAQKKEKENLKDAKTKWLESNKKLADIHALTGDVTKEK
eukprot:12720317-Ditylum_brightwellii.AAC.1